MAGKSTRTILSKQELGQCLATGTSRADIAEYQRDGFTFEEILDLCQTAKVARDEEKQADADREAKAHKRAMKPENEHHPAKSVYSYPEGDVARPRPPLECRTLYAGHELKDDTSLAREIELVNQVQLSGKYGVEKSDGSRVTVEVEIERDYEGKPTKKNIVLPARGKHNWPSQVTVLESILAEQARRQTEGMVAHG